MGAALDGVSGSAFKEMDSAMGNGAARRTHICPAMSAVCAASSCCGVAIVNFFLDFARDGWNDSEPLVKELLAPQSSTAFCRPITARATRSAAAPQLFEGIARPHYELDSTFHH